MSELLGVFRDLRRDMKNLIDTVNKLNDNIANLDKAVASMDRLQQTIESNEGNLTRLIEELTESNENIKSVLNTIEKVKEET